jgi:hypothetical protein
VPNLQFGSCKPGILPNCKFGTPDNLYVKSSIFPNLGTRNEAGTRNEQESGKEPGFNSKGFVRIRASSEYFLISKELSDIR